MICLTKKLTKNLNHTIVVFVFAECGAWWCKSVSSTRDAPKLERPEHPLGDAGHRPAAGAAAHGEQGPAGSVPLGLDGVLAQQHCRQSPAAVALQWRLHLQGVQQRGQFINLIVRSSGDRIIYNSM